MLINPTATILKWIFYFYSDPFSIYTSPLVLKSFSGFVSLRLEKISVLKMTRRFCLTRSRAYIFKLLSCCLHAQPATFHLWFYMFLRVPLGVQCSSPCCAHLSPSSSPWWTLAHPSRLSIKRTFWLKGLSWTLKSPYPPSSFRAACTVS